MSSVTNGCRRKGESGGGDSNEGSERSSAAEPARTRTLINDTCSGTEILKMGLQAAAALDQQRRSINE